MRRITEDDLTLVNATGERYPPRARGAEAAGHGRRRFVLLTGLLFVIGLCWEAFA